MRTYFWSLLIFISTATNAQTPNSWTRKADFGGGGRIEAVGFSINGTGYIDLGTGATNFVREVWAYDTASNTWTRKRDFPSALRVYTVGFSLNNNGYIGTGLKGGSSPNLLNDFWQYDPTNDTFIQKANLLGVARTSAIGFSIGGKGYIGLGEDQNGSYLNDFYEYDPSTDTWTRKADFPLVGRDYPITFTIGGMGYVGLGYKDSLRKDLWEYNPIINTWSQKADFPGIGRTSATAFSIGSRAFVGFGTDGYWQTYTDLYEYNSVSNTWSQKADLPAYGREWAAGFSIGGKGYIGTGFDSNRIKLSDFWEYTPDTLSTTGIGNIATNEFNISPNPATVRLGIATSLHDLSVSISDITGRSYAVPYSDREIDISSLTAGIYFLQLYSSEGSTVRRFVKE